ncbi:pseudouridine synthase [Okeanomitos corallinicola TIOX110]|uniref:RNA pseudouridylate synthase n=1 Tax=Okeanomitos corallinicola TIOX110 TaxID=3133117 RepID=A0ABZ2V1S5_9CYAN
MVILHPLSDFINVDVESIYTDIQYYYQGKCPQTGEVLQLPRTTLSESIAKGLMQQLSQNPIYSQEGKMYGILLVELPNGEQRVIQAFSGLLNGDSVVDAWVTPIPGREDVSLLESQTLAKLESIKQEIIKLKQIPEREEYQKLSLEFQQQLDIIKLQHQHSKQLRQQKRQEYLATLIGENLTTALAALEAESRQQGIEKKNIKRHQQEVLQPLENKIAAAEVKIRELKKQRKAISRELQSQMHAAYKLMNFHGKSLSLQQLFPWGTPTGTGECCAPKLLHYAASHNLKPLAMAEFWWGESLVKDKIQGEFYGACAERCQPLMGFLLSGLKMPSSKDQNLEIIYQDQWLIAVHKPAGLLSVPGRYLYNQDSVFSRLKNLDDGELRIVHRLDQETSGILILAKDKITQSQLHQQFANRQVDKIYEAILAGSLNTNQGIIDLPLWGNPENRPYQIVDFEKGKPSITKFRVMGKQESCTRVEFIPLTGRTHQIRVHSADILGLGVNILGDRLYGCNDDITRLEVMCNLGSKRTTEAQSSQRNEDGSNILYQSHRLYLHAREITFQHPHTGVNLHLQTKTPF